MSVEDDQSYNKNHRYKKIPAELLKTRRGLHASKALNEKEKDSEEVPEDV